MKRNCDRCGAIYEALGRYLRRNQARFCSKSCGMRGNKRRSEYVAEHGFKSADRRRQLADPVKEACRRKTRWALKCGKLCRQPCRDCGADKAQAHHPDYSKPYDIIWLCQRHHRQEHANNPALQPLGNRGPMRPFVYVPRKPLGGSGRAPKAPGSKSQRATSAEGREGAGL